MSTSYSYFGVLWMIKKVTSKLQGVKLEKFLKHKYQATYLLEEFTYSMIFRRIFALKAVADLKLFENQLPGVCYTGES